MVTLYLMTEKGFKVLEATFNQLHLKALIAQVVVGRDNNIDNDFADKIIELCKLNSILCFERTDVFEDNSIYSFSVSWRWMIPESKSRLIVFHDSLLPKYRGFAPLVNMLINKEKEIGVSAIFASKEYDKGELIAQASTKISYPIKISEAISLISVNYIELIINLLNSIAKGNRIESVVQDEKKASYSLWREEEDYLIDWSQDSSSILNFINAVSSPYKGASTYLNKNQKIRILKGEIEDDVFIENRDVGKVIFIKNKQPVIVCGSGLVRLTEVIDDLSQENILPFKKFRLRLSSNL